MMNSNSIRQAEQRVKEMERMTRQYSEQGNRFMRQTSNNAVRQEQPRFEPVRQQSNTYNHPKPQKPPQQKKSPQTPPEHTAENNTFPIIQLDNEKLMLLLIMYILIKEKSDIKLILALGYLIL